MGGNEEAGGACQINVLVSDELCPKPSLNKGMEADKFRKIGQMPQISPPHFACSFGSVQVVH